MGKKIRKSEVPEKCEYCKKPFDKNCGIVKVTKRDGDYPQYRHEHCTNSFVLMFGAVEYVQTPAQGEPDPLEPVLKEWEEALKMRNLKNTSGPKEIKADNRYFIV